MRLLLDTHIIWWIFVEPARLKARLTETVMQDGVQLYYSPLSSFELAIKRMKGQLEFKDEMLMACLQQWAMREVPVSQRHTLVAGNLPPHHGDPFDRLIIAQAFVEQLTLMSVDRIMRAYDVPLIQG